MTVYSYKSSGIVSHYIRDYAGDNISSLSNQVVSEFTFKQSQTQKISEVNYGTVGDFGSTGVSDEAAILIVGEVPGWYLRSNTITQFVSNAPSPPPGGGPPTGPVTVYEYSSGLVSERLNQYSNSTLISIGQRTIGSFTFFSDNPLFDFNSAEERRTYAYHPAVIDLYNELDYGLITSAHTQSLDQGSINDKTATQVDYGRIYYVTNVESFGFVKVVSEASWKATNSYEGTGTAFTFGAQTAPARYGYITDGKVRCSGTADSAFSPATESRGGLSLHGNTAVGISIGNIIFGKIFSGGITSYATTDVYLSEDLKTLFTTTGAATDIHTRAYEASGTLFNFSGVIEKSVYDYVGSGRLFGFNNLEEARTYDYNPGSINFFYKEDYGFIPTCNSSEDISGVVSGDAASCEVRVIDGSTAIVDLGQVYRPAPLDNLPTAFLDYGFVSETANLEIDYGYITITSDLNPFGLFDISGTGDIAFVPNWVSYGQIKFTGGAFLPIDANIIGTGSIPTLGGAAEVIAVSEESTDLFRFSGDGQIGITVQHFGSGTIFGISGAAEAVAFNPEEEQMLFSFTGELAENITKSHIGEGVLFTLQTAVEKTVYDYVGSGTLFALNSLEESRAYDYNCSSVVVFEDLDYGLIVDRGNLSVTQIGTTTISTPTTGPSGAIQIAVGATVTITPTGSYTVPNQLSTPQYFEDYGLVSEIYDPTRDYGWILGTVAQGQPGCIYGEIDVFGVADIQFVPSFIGSGVIELDGEAYVPLDAKQIGSGTIFSISGAAEAVAYAEETKELFKILGTGQIGITVQHFGSGTLFGISGATEAVAFNPVDITTDIKITGTSGDPTLVYAHLATGTLFNFSGAVEKAVYDYVGDGEINLVARKPETYELSELANFTLDQYQIASNYIDLGDTSFYTGHTQLGPVELKWIEAEEAHEKHTEVYDLNLCDDPEEIDYGLLVNRAALACVPVNGVVGTSTTSSTGCTVIPPGTSLIVPPGVTYTVQPQLLSATDFEDYGHIFGMPSPYRDYGHILEGTGFSCPFGSLGTFNGEAGQAYFRNADKFIEGGTVTIFGAAKLFFTPPYLTEGFVGKISGDAITLFSLLAPSEGGIFKAFSGSAETVLWDPDLEQLGWEFRGAAVPVFSLAHFGSGTIRVTPGVEQARAARPPAGGVINIEGTAVESFIANPPEEAPLFRFTGDLTESFTTEYAGDGNLFAFSGSSELLTFAEQPEVDIKIGGISDNAFVPNHIGSGGLFAFIGTSESRTIDLPAFQADIKFFGAAAESFTPAPEIGSGFTLLSGSTAPEILTFSEQPFGTISVFGESENAYVPNHIGSGSLFAFAGAAEAVGFNPPDITTDLKFFGTAAEAFIANPPEEGTEIRLSGDTTPQILTFAEQPFGTISVFGDAATPRARDFVGSGTLRKISGAAESITFNPEEKQMLFSFTGGITSEKHTEVYVGVDTPIRIRRGSLSDFQTYDWQPSWVSEGTIPVRGEAGLRYVPNNVGFGNIFTIGGSAEAVTFNPDERQMLFSFTGELTERTSASHVGEGNLFAFSGGAERVAYAPTLLADIRLNGQVGIRYVPNNVGSGNIFTIGGSSESVTFNPDERQLLFSFTGELVEAFGAAETKQIEVDVTGDGSFIRAFAHEGSGTLTITGDSFDRFVVNNIGFGNIFTIGGSAEAVTFNPDEKQMLFSFTGELNERSLVREISQGGTISITGTSGDPNLTFAEEAEVQVALSGEAFIKASLRHIGSGSLFAFSGGAEAIGAVPPTEQALFKVSGDSENSRTAVYVGSGSLRKLSGAAESVTFNPDERQMLFSFTGAGAENTTAREVSQGGLFKASGEAGVLVRFAHTGEGTISVSGDAHTTRARDFVGFGTLRKISGAAESLTFNPTERDMLFSFTGERISEKTTFRELGTAGKFTFTGTSGDPLLTFAEQPFVNVDITGDSIDVRTRAYQGSGRLFGFNNGDEAFVRTPYQGSGSIRVDGNAFVQVQLFQPARVYVWII